MKQLLERKHGTRIIVLALLLTMLAWLVPMDWQVAKAAENNVEKISVTGGYLLFDKTTGTITGHEGDVTEVSIPETYEGTKVTCIRNHAFSGCHSLTSMTIPESVTSIGDSAFAYCGLTSVTVPKSVTTIGNAAFGGCHGLSAITVDADNQKYSSDQGVLFDKGKTKLIQYPAGRDASSYEIPDTVAEIGGGFDGCSSLTSVTIPASVTAIDELAFRGCRNLASITIPASVTIIGEWAFRGCSSLTSVTIPESVTSIGDMAFGACESLQSITVDTDNQKYTSDQGVLFDKGKTKLIQYPAGRDASSYKIPDTVVGIHTGAFGSCTGLTSVTIPKSVTSIGNATFYGCISLTSVTIPDSVTTIELEAFCGCSSLISVTIPESVTFIGCRAFSDCPSLASVTIPKSVTIIEEGAFGYYWDYGNGKGELVKVPNFKIYGYSNSSAAAKYARDNGFEYTSLGGDGTDLDDAGNKDDNAQGNNGNGQGDKGGNPGNKTDNTDKDQTNVPASPTKSTPNTPTQAKPGTTVKDKKSNGSYVVTQAKQNGGTATYKKPLDKKKTSVTIPATVEIGGETYKVTAIEKNAFKGNKRLKSVKIGANVEKIGANAFNECTKLKTVKIPKKVEAIQKRAFADCKNLKSITIQTKKLTKKTVGAKAFKGVNKKATVKTPKGKAKAYAKLLRSKGLGKEAKVK